MNVCLVVLSQGRWSGKSVPVTRPRFVIGRAAQCDLRPASLYISGQHCAILVGADQVTVRDLGSTNGTFINGNRLEGECVVHDGDQLKLGPLLFELRLEPSSKAPADDASDAEADTPANRPPIAPPHTTEPTERLWQAPPGPLPE